MFKKCVILIIMFMLAIPTVMAAPGDVYLSVPVHKEIVEGTQPVIIPGVIVYNNVGPTKIDIQAQSANNRVVAADPPQFDVVGSGTEPFKIVLVMELDDNYDVGLPIDKITVTMIYTVGLFIYESKNATVDVVVAKVSEQPIDTSLTAEQETEPISLVAVLSVVALVVALVAVVLARRRKPLT